jgi:hypothetical protein
MPALDVSHEQVVVKEKAIKLLIVNLETERNHPALYWRKLPEAK